MDNNSSGSPSGSPQDMGGYSDDDMIEDDQDIEAAYQADNGLAGNDAFGMGGDGRAAGVGGAIRRHRRKQQAGQHLVCTICGDDACGYNFDALTCHSCKLFFRRNAFRTLACPFNKACQIDKVRRKFCAACRLSKCFDVGMKREFIKVAPITSTGNSGGNVPTSSAGASGPRESRKSPKTECNPTAPGNVGVAAQPQHQHQASGAGISSSQMHPDAINQMVSALSVKAEPGDLSSDQIQRQLPSGGANVSMSNVFGGVNMPPLPAGIDLQALQQAGINLSSLQQAGINLSSLQQAGINLGSLQQAGINLGSLQQAGINLSSLQQGGLNLSGLQAGLNMNNLHQAGLRMSPTGPSPPGPGQMGPGPSGSAQFGQLPFGVGSGGPGLGAPPSAGAAPGPGAQLPFGLTIDQLRAAFGGVLPDPSGADRQRVTSGDDSVGHVVSSFSQPDSPSSTSVASSGATILRPLYNPLEETISLTEFEYDRMLMICSSGWKVAISPVSASEFEEAANKSRQNTQMSILNALSRSLFQYFNYIEFGVRKTVSAFKQVPEFRDMPQVVQMKLLKAATLSVLNVSAVFIFDADKQHWVIRMSTGEERYIAVRDIVPMLEKLGHAEISEYMLQYTRFHTELRQVFSDDNIVLFVIVLLDLFAPSRFDSYDPEMTALIGPIHAKYAVFLKRYIKRHYKAVFSPSGATIGAIPRHGATANQDQVRQLADDQLSCADDDIESASVVNEPSGFRPAKFADGGSQSDDADTSSGMSHSLIAFVFEKLNDHARNLEGYLMRLSARMLVNGSALSPLLREVLQIAENAFEYQLNQLESN